jgi:methyl-accepting chemotaxis protein
MFLNIASAKNVEKYQKSWDAEKQKLSERFAELEKTAVLPQDQEILKEAKANLEKYASGFQNVVLKIRAEEIKTPAEANAAMVEYKEATHKAVQSVEDLAKECAKRVNLKQESVRAQIGKVMSILTGVGIIIVLTGVGVSILLTRSVTRPMNLMQSTIAEVDRNSDFTRRIPVSSKDEFGQIAHSFNKLMAALQQTLSQVLDSVAKVSDAAQTLSAASSQVATSSSSQSEATSSMAAAIEQMTVSINHVSDSAHEALDISRTSGKLSTEGGDVISKAASEMSQIEVTVRHTAQAIEDLDQQSNQISSIVQVIKDVADQTNLLALNAAIEAARAGEQGRGFAVVADEVRKLAERTTKATEEITQMIGSMQHSAQTAVSTMETAVDQVSGGVALANQAGSAIVQIKDGAEQVVGVVNDISSALAEQSSASNDIAAQVEKVAQMTEENSAAAAETSSAANNLQELASDMRETVNRFKI